MPAPPLSLAAIRQPAFLYDAGGRIVEANDLAEALAGRPLAGRTLAAMVGLFDIHSPDGSPLLAADMPAGLALAGDEAVDVPLVVRAADGRTVHILATASPILDGDALAGALVIWQDVSALETAAAEQARLRLESNTRGAELEVQNEELRAAEEELRRSSAELQAAEHRLRESEEQYRSLAENVPSVLMRYDADLRVVYLSAQAEQFTGIPASEFIGRTNREVGMPDDLCTLWESAMAEVFRTGEPGDLEFDLPSPDGPLTFYLRFAPEFGPEGDVRHVLGISTEITDRKRAEEALLASRTTLRAAFGSMAEAVFISDAEGRFVEFNDAFVAYHRFKSRDECSRSFETCSTLFDVWFAETGEPAPPEMWAVPRALAGERGANVEYMLRSRETGETWIGLYNFSPIRNEDGAITGSVITARDITEQRRAEDALRRGEEHLKLAQETAHVGTTIWDQRTGTLWWSEEQRRIFGIDPETEITFERYLSLVHPEDRSYVINAIDEGFSTKKTEGMNYRIIRPDRKIRFIHGEGRIFYDGDTPSYVIGTVQDVTERKRAEEALRESESRLVEAQRLAKVGDWEWDLATGNVVWSWETSVLFGRDPDLAAPTTPELPRYYTPESWARLMEGVQRAIETGEPYDLEVEVVREDGEHRWLVARGEAVRDAAGAVTKLRGTVQDITDMKEAEEALREYAENLRRSNEDLERFAYVSSHDLQEPLRAIVSFSQLLERRYKGQLDADADDYINFIVEGGIRMQVLIQDLLAYSRVNTTKQALTPTVTEDVLAAVERNLALQLGEAGAVLSHDPMPTVLADPMQLEQVFTNLISNAIKFRRPDEPLRIHIGARRLDGFWEFSVSDNGIGIEAEYFEKIFVIFQRLHTKDAYPGTGIGLAIVKRIIDRHGGTIRVESVPGEGSTFFFTLPAA